MAMHLAGDGPGTHFMLFKGESFLVGESTMTEAKAPEQSVDVPFGGTNINALDIENDIHRPKAFPRTYLQIFSGTMTY